MTSLSSVCSENMKVSIHTPTQGVTELLQEKLDLIRVSIHTPTQGVTLNAECAARPIQVSIHTPTQGVTNSEVLLLVKGSFNPHTHAGCDYIRTG